MSETSDEALLAAIDRGKRDAAEEFFRRHRRAAFRVAWRILGREADALDAVEDSFEKAFKAAGSFRGEAKARTWFLRIVTNTSLDARRKRRGHASLDAAGEDERPLSNVLPSDEEEPDARAERRELGEHIQAAVDALGEKHRAVFVLVVVEGMSYREAARALDIKEGTVMSRLFYARKALQETLNAYLEEK